MLSISFQQLILGVLLNCIAIYMVKYIDSIIQRILNNKVLNQILITINVLIVIAAVLLIANTNIH
jgi:ABC-type dipeptide/oligopeptide/nickel transport system permease subunit